MNALSLGSFLSTISLVRLRTHMMEAKQYEGGGRTLPYRIYVPKSRKAGERYPVVLFLHGGGNDGTDNRRQTDAFGIAQPLLSRRNRAKYPCILIAPQSQSGRWEDGLLPTLMGILEHTAANYPVDPARVYVTGLSKGGVGAWAMLAAYPAYFAAGVPVCGGWNPQDAPLLRDIPIWAFHGAKDPIRCPDDTRRIVKALERIGAARVKYTEYPREGNWCWGRAYYEPELFPWMFAQARKGERKAREREWKS